MTIPKRITFQYLYRTLPEINSVKEFNQLISALEEKGWIQPNSKVFGSNFYGMLVYGLRPEVRRQVLSS